MVFAILSFSLRAMCATPPPSSSALISFRPGSDILYPDYSLNNSNLKLLTATVTRNKDIILSGNGYIRLEAFVPPAEKDNPVALNMAAIRAAVVRTYLCGEFPLFRKRCFTFCFNTDGSSEDNSVRVVYCDGRVPADASPEIYYSLQQNNVSAINAMLSKYDGGIPFAAAGPGHAGQDETSAAITYPVQQQADDDRAVAAEELTIHPDTVVPVVPVTSEPQSEQPSLPVQDKPQQGDQPESLPETQPETQPQLQLQSPSSGVRYPVALKTNLLYDMVGAANLGVEIPIGERWSVVGDAAFSYWRAPNHLYALQTLEYGFSGRYWLNIASESRRQKNPEWRKPLRGLVFGIYGRYWQRYDVQLRDGCQGDASWSVGLTAGYAFPIARNLSLEAGIGAGYFSTSEYRTYDRPLYDDQGQYHLMWRETGKWSGIALTKVNLSLVWLIANRKGGQK